MKVWPPVRKDELYESPDSNFRSGWIGDSCNSSFPSLMLSCSVKPSTN